MAEEQPKHLAIIMDGNGRWATSKGKDRLFGHAEGAKTIESIANHIKQNHPFVKYLTVYAFAIKNRTRNKFETVGLERLFEHQVTKLLPGLIKNNVRTRVVGNRQDAISTDLLASIERLEKGTAQCNGLCFQIAWNYSGKDEINRAQAAGWGVTELYQSMFDAPDVPKIDILVRTGVDNPVSLNVRDSDFFPLLSADAVKVPLTTLWPDFSPSDIELCLAVWRAEAHLNGGQRQTIKIVASR